MTSERTHIASAVAALHSGECRWIGRHDVHVYCRRPMVQELIPATGRMGWRPGPATYSVVCPAEGLRHGDWIGLVEAVQLVEKAVQSVQAPNGGPDDE